MLDLNSYMLYELLLSRRQELDKEEIVKTRKRPSVRFSFVAWTLASLGSTLVASGRRLKDRYEPRVHARPQTSN
jgi:hypothetical protein